MTGTDKDRTEINSRLWVSFCYANNVVLHLCPANYGKVEKMYRLLVEQRTLFMAILTK
jgi:hypothetical protein